MTTLTIELPPEVYDRLSTVAREQQKPVETLASEWLVERSTSAPQPTERERVRAALRAAGLLVELPPDAQRMKPLSEEERSRLAAQIPPGRPLSEIIIEDRGPY